MKTKEDLLDFIKKNAFLVTIVIFSSIFIFIYSGSGLEDAIMAAFVLVMFFFFAVFLGKKMIDEIHDYKSTVAKVFASIFAGLFLLVFGGFLIFGIYQTFFGNEDTRVADGFTIEGYEVILDVLVDNKVNVTEQIDVNFYDSNHHGIYKFTPLWLEYTGINNKTIKRKSTISNYQAIGDNYIVDNVKKKSRIKIGDANRTVYGNKKYIIEYTYDMGKDPYENFDEFIFHSFGDYWGTEIKNPKIIVHMPKNIDGYKVNFFTDKYRNNNVNNMVNYEIDGNTLIATYDSSKGALNKSLTVDIELPEGYFEGGSWNYGWVSFVISMIVIGLTGYTIFRWSRVGKNLSKKVPTVEFYPPDDLNSAEIGYVYNKRQATKKLTISLIIQLASKGYIKIDEVKGKNKHDNEIMITKLYATPKKPVKDLANVPEKGLMVLKVKDIDENLNKKEKSMMKYLFANDKEKLLTSNLEKFAEVKDKLIQEGYIKITKELSHDDLLKEKEQEYELLLKQYEEESQKYRELPKKSRMENIVYSQLFDSENQIILSEHRSFYETFDKIAQELEDKFKKKIHDAIAEKQKRISTLLNIVITFLCLTSFMVVEDMDPSWNILYYISFACIPINIIFTIIMGKKTAYGEIISARVKGFRNFLVTAEKEQLEDLVEKNPHYFYDILPYTYVLNISKKWISKFENIKMPKSDMGSFDYGSDRAFYTMVSSVYTSSGSSFGSSGCGGGCSSCGGGCSSCGGGGSW